jgi:hypothetical protein
MEFVLSLLKWLADMLGKLIELRNRNPVLKVRIQEDDPDKIEGGLQFEVENASEAVTSLSPHIALKYQSAKGERKTLVFDVREAERHLPPFTPKLFSASARENQHGREHGWYRRYIFKPTRGKTSVVRIRNAELDAISPAVFLFESWRFALTGQVTLEKTSMTIDEFNAAKRARGPH